MTKLILSLVSAAAAANLKIGVVSDPHYNAFYQPYASGSNCMAADSGEVYAPIGRYECDASPAMFDLMMTRFKDVFGEVDVLLVPGDHVAHQVSAKDDDPTGAEYEAVKQNLATTWAMFAHYFPNTMILPTVGNNDGRFHDEAIDE